eukprot:SAG31_NODE_2595_length_5421_cov_2.387636_3_plen_105_part_00
MWKHPSVLELFAETYISKQIREEHDGEKHGFQNLKESVSLVRLALEQLNTDFNGESTAVAQALRTFTDENNLFDSFPCCTGDSTLFHRFLQNLVMTVCFLKSCI